MKSYIPNANVLVVTTISLGLVLFLLRSTSLQRNSGLIQKYKNILVSSDQIIKLLDQNGTQPCHNVSTTIAYFFGLPKPENGSEIRLQTDIVHKFWIVSYDSNGSRRCFGGDFYETDLSGKNWKSRPPIRDMGDGSYLVELKVDGSYTGMYTFKSILLYSNLHGMDRTPDAWAVQKELVTIQINFTSDSSVHHHLSPPDSCRATDFETVMKWSGRWTRTKFNDSCQLDREGRCRCISENEQCEESDFCTGQVGGLESNGWVYSAHCKFHIWSNTEAWKCLSGKKIVLWGDSNHQDTIRNLMNFVLGFKQEWVDRVFIRNITNPLNSTQMLRLVSIFNGHSDPNLNFEGLETIDVPKYRKYVSEWFVRGGYPDAVILNSGLHDSRRKTDIKQYVQAAKKASNFWDGLVRNMKNPNAEKPAKIIFRTTVAPAGKSRRMAGNPQKMEAFNALLQREIWQKMGDLNPRLVDAYDMTFPWHYDHCCSDGGHYGRPPALKEWYGRIGHYYFVDVMLVHVLLSAICY